MVSIQATAFEERLITELFISGAGGNKYSWRPIREKSYRSVPVTPLLAEIISFSRKTNNRYLIHIWSGSTGGNILVKVLFGREATSQGRESVEFAYTFFGTEGKDPISFIPVINDFIAKVLMWETV